MAPTNESSQRLSERAQAYRIETGEVAGAGTAAQQASDTDRQAHGQDPTTITRPQKERPRLMTRLEKMVAEQQARKAAEQKPAEKTPETDAQRQGRLAAEQSVREQQRTMDQAHGQDLGH